MLRRTIRDADDARACLDALVRSGRPQAEWTRDNGVDGRSLRAWRRLLKREDETKAAKPVARPLRLVELVAATEPPQPAPKERAAPYVIRCGELSVEVDEHFDETVLRRLLAVVTSC